jgi:osmotically-inducible protein OsmY
MSTPQDTRSPAGKRSTPSSGTTRRSGSTVVRSGDPGLDWYLESSAAPDRGDRQVQDERARQLRRMSWRAAGMQDYPGGALEDMLALSHRGRGPKGYRRSDARLTEIICDLLTDSPEIDASEVAVEVRDCDVTLEGSVPLRRMKYAIEDLVAGVSGVDEIHNRITVIEPERWTVDR